MAPNVSVYTVKKEGSVKTENAFKTVQLLTNPCLRS